MRIGYEALNIDRASRWLMSVIDGTLRFYAVANRLFAISRKTPSFCGIKPVQTWVRNPLETDEWDRSRLNQFTPTESTPVRASPLAAPIRDLAAKLLVGNQISPAEATEVMSRSQTNPWAVVVPMSTLEDFPEMEPVLRGAEGCCLSELFLPRFAVETIENRLSMAGGNRMSFDAVQPGIPVAWKPLAGSPVSGYLQAIQKKGPPPEQPPPPMEID
jgi:hypothetical protein